MRPPVLRASVLRWLRWLFFTGGLYAGLLVVLTFQFLPGRYNLNEGDVSPYHIKSPVRVTYISQVRTQAERARAAAAIPEIMVFDATVGDRQRQRATELFGQIESLRRSPLALPQRIEALQRLPELAGLETTLLSDLLRLEEPEWQAVMAETLRLLDHLYRGRIGERQLEEIQQGIPALVSPSLAERPATLTVALVRRLLRPNYTVDAEATARARREAQEKVAPVWVTIERGETILRDGDVVRAFDLERLEAVGLRNPQVQWRSVVGTALPLGVLVGLLAVYLARLQPRLLESSRRLLLLLLVLLLATLAAKLTLPGRDLYAYLFPLAACPMLVALLLGPELALVAGVVAAVLFAFVVTPSLELVLVGLAGALAGALSVARVERLHAFLVAGLAVGGAVLAVSAGFQLLAGEADLQRLALLGLLALINGGLSAILTLGAAALLGHLFGITTTLGLLELAHPNQPLFRRLLTEAPGTYHHSLVVANLAERAAEAVGADALLARVGAYYHDIGKLLRPYAFAENQFDSRNIHDHLDPVTSARLIIAHVADGLELAQRSGLPSRVRDLIAQHHGTRFAGYFYQRALQEIGPDVDPALFRYPGPPPQSKEAAILMLADSVEAAVRAAPDRSPERLRQIVQRVVGECLAEGQLDQCDLTLRDLETIRQVFFTILQGMYHPRVQYPERLALAAPPASARSGESHG
jgi:putative nucleotidyltransferase with HDIG domain